MVLEPSGGGYKGLTSRRGTRGEIFFQPPSAAIFLMVFSSKNTVFSYTFLKLSKNLAACGGQGGGGQ